MRAAPPAVLMFLCALALPAEAQVDAKPKPKAAPETPDWTVSGTLYTDFSAVHADKHQRNPIPEEGIFGEYSVGGVYNLDKHMSVTIRACMGCHEFQFQSAYADVELTEQWTFRVGRLPVPFGGFSRRTNPAHFESGTKPLPYIMGGMVREREFNMGIVPAPFVDNGASVTGKFWITKSATLTLEAGVVRGLKGFTTDFDYVVTRDLEDNNGEPAGAVRALVNADPVTAGASVMYGRYDPDGELAYTMFSVEASVKVGDWNVRLEGIVRETDFLTPTLSEDTSRRTGYIVQVDGPIVESWRAFLLFDGLKVEDLFLSAAGPVSFQTPNTTDDSNTITRVAGGFVYSARPGLIVKGSVEFWDPSDFDEALVFHLGVVVEY